MLDNITVQKALAAKGAYTDTIDGDYGNNSKTAARKIVSASVPLYKPAWNDARVRLALEQLLMAEAGIDVGDIDGVEGVMTQHGWELWQNRMRGGRPPARPTAINPAAFCRQSDAERFYGAPGTNHTRITPPYQVYYGDQKVGSILINQKCADSALRAMQSILSHYGAERIHELGVDRYGGCFNDRPMRGGTRKSMHAYACAIDWDPARNPLRADHRTAQFAKPEYAAFLDAWEAEGWTSLGRARDFDWMHVQAARL
jgi:hypothetical protein